MVDFLFNPLLTLINASPGNEAPLCKDRRKSVTKTIFLDGAEDVTDTNHLKADSARSSTESISSSSIAATDIVKPQRISIEEDTSAAYYDVNGARITAPEGLPTTRRRIFNDYWRHSSDAAPYYLSTTQYPVSLTTRQMPPAAPAPSIETESTQALALDENAKSHQSLTNEYIDTSACHTLSSPDLTIQDKARSKSPIDDTWYIDSDATQGREEDQCDTNIRSHQCMQQQAYHPFLPPIRKSSSMEKLHKIEPKPELNKSSGTQQCGTINITHEFPFDNMLPLPTDSAIRKQTSNSSFSSSTVSDQCPSYYGGTENTKPVSILRKPRCHSRQTSVDRTSNVCNGNNVNSGAESKCGESFKADRQPEVPKCSRNIMKSSLRRPTTPTSAVDVCLTSPKPLPHVSLFKRPDSVRLPWRIGDSELPSWFTKPFYQNKGSLSFSCDSIDESRPEYSMASGGRSTSYGFVEEHRWTSHVQFDPRIGVVEYIEDDDHVEEYKETNNDSSGSRSLFLTDKADEETVVSSKWFSAEELNQFKLDALQQAQLMLLSLPKSRLNSHLCTSNQLQQRRGSNKGIAINGARMNTPRSRAPIESPIPRRASFANPILHYTPEDILVMEGSEELASLLRSHIRSVLVVDPSEDLRALFQKYFTYLFPKTKVLTTANAEGAFKLIEAAKLMEINTTLYNQERDTHCKVSCNGFDIIIVEENLRRKTNTERDSDDDADDDSFEDRNSSSDEQQVVGKDTEQGRRSSCSSHAGALAMSGSELINLMTKAEKALMNLKSQQGDPCSLDPSMSNKFRPSLYIGVSLFLSDDGPKFLKSGADLIWGKPPPKIDENLRNNLVTSLLKKRGESVLICSP